MQLHPYTLDKFNEITNLDVRAFLQNYALFYERDYFDLTTFYQGNTNSLNKDAFDRLAQLDNNVSHLLEGFHSFADLLISLQFIELLDTLEEIKRAFDTLKNISRWSRASKDLFGYSSHKIVEKVLSQHETLESMARKALKSDSVDDWYNIAIKNKLAEDAYSVEGGKIIRLTVDNEIENFDIRSVVDIMSEETWYGKDLTRTLALDTIEQDFVTLSPDDTLQQSAEILLSLRKGDNKDLPTVGLQAELVVGMQRSLLNFPLIERQLKEVFATDDTFASVALKDCRIENDNIFITVEIIARDKKRALNLNTPL